MDGAAKNRSVEGEAGPAGNNDAHPAEHTPVPNHDLQGLSLLAGTWRTEVNLPTEPPMVVHGKTTCEWHEEGPFLVVQGSVEDPMFPRLLAIIGRDETTDAYSMLYSDSRGVARIYQMSLSNEVWTLWRDAPGFSQRYTGRFSDDGNVITGYWEKSEDGLNWELDFNLTYTKVKGAAR